MTKERNGKGRLRECKSMKCKMLEGDYIYVQTDKRNEMEIMVERGIDARNEVRQKVSEM